MTEITKKVKVSSELIQDRPKYAGQSEKSPKNNLIMHDELKAKHMAKMENKNDKTDESKLSSWFNDNQIKEDNEPAADFSHHDLFLSQINQDYLPSLK